MKISCWIIFSLVSQFILIQSAHIYSATAKKMYYNSCGCREILDRKERIVERTKRSIQRNGNKFEETATGTNIFLNDDNSNKANIHEQPTRRRNRKKRELNYLKVDDVDIDFTDGNNPTVNFKIEVNLSSLADFKQEYQQVKTPDPGKSMLVKVVLSSFLNSVIDFLSL